MKTNYGTSSIFFFNDTATTEIYTLSLHDALPIYPQDPVARARRHARRVGADGLPGPGDGVRVQPGRLRHGLPVLRDRRSEEHTSELQSRQYLVCRLLLEKKKSMRSIIFVATMALR